MTIRFRSIIDVSKATALGSGAGFVHKGKGQFFAAYCVVIDPFLSQVDPCAFASDETVQQLLKEMEDSFTARFAKGDKKRALVRLRTVTSYKTHHFSTFRTGVALGLAFPAAIDGIVRCESSNIPRCLLSILQASNPIRVLIYHLGRACSLFMRICWSQHFWHFSWAQTCYWTASG
ncbi:hypothetical protein BJV77DRAFT_940549 [Russula vinacea]|nr:hypothetical protein BJV77DRAFT_940549 [Russula vinacea]